MHSLLNCAAKVKSFHIRSSVFAHKSTKKRLKSDIGQEKRP